MTEMGALENADYAELAREKAAKLYSRRLSAHPDPRDPEWPGHAREMHEQDVIERARNQAEVARDYLIRAIDAKNSPDADSLYRLIGAAEEELIEVFNILKEVME